MTTILMVRHGESEANRANVFAGSRLDAALCDTGRLQAKRYAEWAVANYKIDKVYASDMSRAFETGKACADLLGLEAIKNEGLREIDGGEWEGMTLTDIFEKYPEAFEVWRHDIASCTCPGGENVTEMGERVKRALEEIARENEGKTILVATHYTPIRAMQTFAVTGTFSEMQKFGHIPNTSITELFFENGKWSAGELNLCRHLENAGEVPEILK